MKRNMLKIIETTKTSEHYDITYREMQLLKEQYETDGDMFKLMSNLFVFGYAMGIRAEKATHKI